MGCTAGVEPFLGLRSSSLIIQEHKTRYRRSRITGKLEQSSQAAHSMVITQTCWTALHRPSSCCILMSCAALSEHMLCARKHWQCSGAGRSRERASHDAVGGGEGRDALDDDVVLVLVQQVPHAGRQRLLGRGGHEGGGPGGGPRGAPAMAGAHGVAGDLAAPCGCEARFTQLEGSEARGPLVCRDARLQLQAEAEPRCCTPDEMRKGLLARGVCIGCVPRLCERSDTDCIGACSI